MNSQHWKLAGHLLYTNTLAYILDKIDRFYI